MDRRNVVSWETVTADEYRPLFIKQQDIHMNEIDSIPYGGLAACEAMADPAK